MSGGKRENRKRRKRKKAGIDGIELRKERQKDRGGKGRCLG